MGESQDQVKSFIRLTNLIPELLELVDNSLLKEKDMLQIALRPAVEFSYLKKEEQADLFQLIKEIECTPSHAQAIIMRKLAEGKETSERLTKDAFVARIAVLVIVVNCIIGLLAGSCFGIFFSGEDNGSGQTMPAVVREINEEYEARLDEIKAANSHDVLEMAAWREVLAIYAVKTSTDPINPQEVATLDDGKKQLLKVVFLQMNEISHSTSTQTETVVIETDDGHGNIVETETTVTRTTLYITAGHKTVDEMA